MALSILDPENPYRYIQVRGRVVEMTKRGADAHIDALAKKYLGQDTYPFRRPGEVRVTVTDTQTGAVKVYHNPENQAALPVQDTDAFATCP